MILRNQWLWSWLTASPFNRGFFLVRFVVIGIALERCFQVIKTAIVIRLKFKKRISWKHYYPGDFSSYALGLWISYKAFRLS